MNSAVRAYQLALTDPFHPGANGARVLDMFSAPTTTAVLEGIVTVKSDASGNAYFAVTADPETFLIALSSTTNFIGPNFTTMGPAGFIASPQAMQSLFANWRVVGSGLKVRNLTPVTAATGRIIVAKIPVCGQYPGYYDRSNIITAGGTIEFQRMFRLMTGYDNGSGLFIPQGILAWPGATEYTAQDLIAGTLKCNLHPVDPRAFWFRDAEDNNTVSAAAVKATMSGGDAKITGLDPAALAADTLTHTVSGHECAVFACTGLAASVPVFQIHYKIHLEGTPNVTNVNSELGLINPIQTNVSNSPVEPGVFERILAAAREYDIPGLVVEGIGRVLSNRNRLRDMTLDTATNLIL